uniref:Uncharacterized protein n=1 Tax=Ananas comosus var. bracteatus TaxID=296719 RepID=A0A6V7Q597_ANACO|nr:unnamed protein product [Ananas comosus var. bracteatus]
MSCRAIGPQRKGPARPESSGQARPTPVLQHPCRFEVLGTGTTEGYRNPVARQRGVLSGLSSVRQSTGTDLSEYRYWSLVLVLHCAGTGTLRAVCLAEARVARVWLPGTGTPTQVPSFGGLISLFLSSLHGVGSPTLEKLWSED